MTNINKDTGIRYGVTSHCQTLIDEIFDNGEDESFKAWKEEQIGIIAAALAEVSGGDADSDSIKENAENAFDDLEVDYQSEESEYSYEDSNGNQFLLSWLGGAPLVYCVKTSAIVHVKSLCSPCVPNAGDLDSGLNENGHECYGIPAEYLEAENA